MEYNILAYDFRTSLTGLPVSLFQSFTTGATSAYSINYHANTPSGATGGTVPSAITNIASGASQALTAPTAAPTRTGGIYTFKGWSTATNPALDADIDYGGTATIQNITANINLYAVWKFAPNKYTITWDANGGTVKSKTSEVYHGAKIGSLPTSVREGYELAGWWTEAIGGVEIAADTTVTANATYYAHWTASGSDEDDDDDDNSGDDSDDNNDGSSGDDSDGDGNPKTGDDISALWLVSLIASAALITLLMVLFIRRKARVE
jgi:uncharacterized repeat protein (TIGR02543 family)/LPXTG-motif cell wall-anchored protein